MTFDEQKREAIATAKHLVEILSEVHDKSLSTTADEAYWMREAHNQIATAMANVLSILGSQDNSE